MADCEAKLSRGGFTGLFGKLSEEPINGLKLPIVVEERAKEKAAQLGLPYLEFLRESISLQVMGRNEFESRFRRRLDAIEGSVEE